MEDGSPKDPTITELESASELEEPLTLTELEAAWELEEHPIIEEREAAAAEALDDARRILCEAAPRAAQALVDGLDDDDPRVALAAAAALLDRVGMVKGAAAPPPPAPEVNDEELVAKINRLVASIAREAPATG